METVLVNEISNTINLFGSSSHIRPSSFLFSVLATAVELVYYNICITMNDRAAGVFRLSHDSFNNPPQCTTDSQPHFLPSGCRWQHCRQLIFLTQTDDKQYLSPPPFFSPLFIFMSTSTGFFPHLPHILTS